MFYSFRNHSDKPDLDGFPKWIVVQANNALEANEMLAMLVGLDKISTADDLRLFDPYLSRGDDHCGKVEPTACGRVLSNGPPELVYSEVYAGEYRVYYAAGVVVSGYLKSRGEG